MNRSLFSDYWGSLRDPEFWIYATWLGLVTKYRQSRLGLLWALVPPALYAFGIGWFFASIQGISARGFIPHLGIGYVVFRLITVCLNEATTAFASHVSFIQDGRVRLTDYVLRVVSKALFYFLLAAPVIGVTLYLSPQFNPLGLLVLPLGLAVVLLSIGWMSIVIGVIGARLSDVHQLVGSVLMFSFLFTPIIWYAEQAPGSTLRGAIARANPLFHLVELVRAPLLNEPLESLTFIYLALFLIGGWGLAAFIYRRYARFVPIWI